MLITLLLVSLLLAAVSVIAPDTIRIPVLVLGGLMVAVVAFSSVELTLYLLILSTLLSPELTFGGATEAQLASGAVATTVSRGVTLRLDDIILTLISLTWLFRMAIFKELGTVRSTPLNKPIAAYWLVSAFATLIGFYAGRVGVYGFFFVTKYLEYFVLFYMIVNHIHDEAAIKRYISIMLFTCFIACLVGMAQIPGGGRVSAPFEGAEGEPNTFGGYLVLLFSIALGIFLNVKDRAQRFRMAMLGLIILVPLAYTESRASYLAFVVSILLFIVFAKQKRTMFAVALVGGLVGVVAMPHKVTERVMFTFDQAREYGQLRAAGINIDTSTSARLFSWARVIYHDFPRHPLLGLGVTGGRFMDAQYPRVLSETGMVGLAMFIWLLRRIWVLLRQGYKRLEDPEIKGVALGTLCGYGGLLFHAIGANSFIIVRIMEPFMILLGLILAAMLLNQDEAGDQGTAAVPSGGLQTAGTT